MAQHNRGVLCAIYRVFARSLIDGTGRCNSSGCKLDFIPFFTAPLPTSSWTSQSHLDTSLSRATSMTTISFTPLHTALFLKTPYLNSRRSSSSLIAYPLRSRRRSLVGSDDCRSRGRQHMACMCAMVTPLPPLRSHSVFSSLALSTSNLL